MSNKNPFEIRFDTLAMAKEMMDRQYETNMQKFYEVMEQAKSQSKDVTELFDKYMPKMYNPSEVMEKAEELYKFVVKKD
jgi:hypothetical protein